jgi:hypothetical protein
MSERLFDEPILADDYPVYVGYAYVVDGKPISSPVGGNVAGLKLALRATEVRRCDIIERQAQSAKAEPSK